MIQFGDFQKVLRVMESFVPKSLVDGRGIGLSISDNGMVFASTSGASALCILDMPIADSSFVLPKDVLPKLLKLDPLKEWSGFKLKDAEVVLRIGNIVVKFPCMDIPECTVDIPDNTSDLPKGFLEELAWMFEFACKDDRKVNLYGLFIDSDYIYACDNVRLTRRKCLGVEQLSGAFLPYPCVDVLCKDKLVASAWQSDNILGFANQSYIFNFSKYGAKFPNLAVVLDRALAVDVVEVNVDKTSEDISEFKGLLTGDLSDSPVKVSFLDERLEVSTLSGISKFKLNLPAKATTSFEAFHIKGLHFIEGLLRFETLKVAEKFVIFQGTNVEQVIMKIVK